MNREIVEPVSAALVPLVRNWMPPDAARTLLDEALGEARRPRAVRAVAASRAAAGGDLRVNPDKWGTQMLHAVLQGGDEPAVATVVTESGRGITQALVIPGMEAISGIAEPDGFDKMIETPWETFEEQVAAALAEGLALERPPPAGLVDVALACGMWELRPPAITARDWLSELDPNGEIAGLPAVVREELIGGSVAWPEDYIVVRGWSEGTTMLHEAIEEGDGENQVKAAFLNSLDSRREDWATADAAQRAHPERRPKSSIGAPSRGQQVDQALFLRRRTKTWDVAQVRDRPPARIPRREGPHRIGVRRPQWVESSRLPHSKRTGGPQTPGPDAKCNSAAEDRTTHQ